jgi:two-component system LytT family sensor kinase
LRAIKKNIHWIVIALMVVGCAKHIFIIHDIFRFPWETAVSDGIISTLILSASVWGIALVIRRYPTTAAITLYALFVAFLMSGVTVFTEYVVLKWILGSDNLGYMAWLKHTLPVRFLVIWVFSIWVATISALRKNITTLDSRFQQQADTSVLLKEAELFKLRQQLQPHFLYNSLNSISALIMISPEKAQEMIGKLSDFLRSSVKREAEDKIPVSEELNYIQSYLAIESIRFGDRLQVNFKKDFTDGATIPPFLLQPILENAIKFGIYGRTGAVVIDFHIALQGQSLSISITNPYDPNMQPPKGTGFGLEGIQRRLYLLYARTDLLETKKDNEYFTTILNIPQHV